LALLAASQANEATGSQPLLCWYMEHTRWRRTCRQL